MSRRTHDAYERWAATYDTDPNPQIVLEEETVLEEIGATTGHAILDAGCGTGRYTNHFRTAGAKVVGLDFAGSMLERAHAKLPAVPFVRADLARPLPFRDACFDRVNCAQTLKHLPSLGATLREFARVLVPGGVLVFSVTHPAMTWDDYEMRESPAFILSLQADIHHHQIEDYTASIDTAGLILERIVPVPVSERIRALLTPESFGRVRGRNQVAVFRARRPDRAGDVRPVGRP